MKKITVLLLSFITLSGFSQTLQEGFEGTAFPPTTPAPGWVVFQNAFGTRQWGASTVAHAGLGAAQMNSRQNIAINNTSKDYLVTPLVTIPANGQLRFWARTENNGNQGTLYQVRVASGANVANQTDEAAFNVAPANLIQQWTEDEISTTYNVYEEKVVNFPAALIGTAVYIAFVNEYTQTTTTISGDTWYLDDVLLVSRCLDPTVLTANPILSTSATLGWTNPNGPTYGNPCTQWEVEIVPSSQLTPSGTGIIVNTNPYIATTLSTAPFAPLLPLTSYKYYVRSICTFSSSLWAGPFSFTTSAAPPQCGGNFVDSGGTTASYSSNENITTTICPTLPGQFVTVNFASFAAENNFDFLKIYNGTSSTAPLLGTFTGTTTPGSFTSTSDTGCLTFVFTSDTSVNSAGWVASITCSTPPTCIQPTALTSSNVTTDSATLAWTSPGTATSWQVLALPCGASAPTSTSSGWLPATTNSLVLNGLTQATCYDLYVRGVCSSTDSSLWSGPNTITTIATCQQPTALTTTLVTATTATLGWTNVGLATAWQVLVLPCTAPAPTAASTGWLPSITNSLLITGLTPTTCYNFYVRGVCSSTDSSLWSGPSTATTQVAPPVCGGNFLDAGGTANYPNNSNSTVTICPTNPGELVTVTFTSFNSEATWDGLYVFDGSSITSPQIASNNPAGNVPGGLAGSYWGTTIPGPFTSTSTDGCLTFNFRSDGAVNNPGWTANITCAPVPTCLQPIALMTSVVTATSATLGWTNAGTATSWQVLALPCTAPTPTAASTGWLPATTNSLVITGLTPATCYNFYVRGVCSDTDSSTWSGPKTATTQVAPPVCGGNFLDAGGTANYPNSSNSTVTICPTNPGEIVTVTFTSFNTEANWDGLYVFDGSSVTSPQIASANPPANVPGGLAGSYWGTTIPGPFTSTSPDGCLTFNFRSDTSVNNPGWVANITCSPAPTCARPIQILATSITQTSASLTWTQPLNPNGSLASFWEVLVLPTGSPIPTAASLGIAATSPYIVQGLNPGTAYTFYVRALCSATESSEWSALVFASLPTNDECSNATFAIVNQNLNCVQSNPGTLAGATASNPITTCPGVANDDVWYSFTATAATHIISFNNITPTTTLNYAIFQGTDCGALTQVGCNSGANLVPGTTYFIRVYSATAIPQYSTFNMCIGTIPCSEAPAFCTGQTVTYANATNVPSLGTIGCLSSSPNPAFFFLQVNQAGPLSYLISQVNTAGAPIDVDYAAWGPFTDLSSACSGVPANPLAGVSPAPTPAQGCPGTLHACSFSAAPQEIICLPNAQLCQVYVIMITNFSNQAGTVTFSQTNAGGGGGATECFPINTFNYSSAYYCQNAANPTPILANGAQNGTYSSTPGLDIDPVSGTINLATSLPGPYIVTSTTFTSTSGVCTTIPTIVTTRTVVITAPASAGISYTPNSFCNSITTGQNITQTGTLNGSYSASPAGLLINPFNGAITPRASIPGTYTVIYTIPASGGCPTVTATTSVTIEAAPRASFNYNSTAYCQTGSNPVLTYTGGGVAGTFSSTPAGLSLDTNTGAINLATSSLGNYTITNTITAIGTCGIISAAFNIAVTSSPLASFSYSSLTFCKNGTNPTPSLLPGASAGAFTSTTGLDINATTGEINLSASTAGLYTVTNTIIAANGCSSDTKTTQVEILANPVIVQPLPVSVCNSYLLPALTVGNYYSQSGGLGAPLDITIPITVSQTVYVYAQNANCSSEKSFIVTINTAPLPTLNVTQPTCTVQTGTIVVTSPVSVGGGIIPNNLFISEVTDESSGSLTYVEIFNGTGASVDLSNYKLKFYNNGGTTTSCNNQLTGILNNNSTFVVSVGSSPSTVITGVTPNISFAGCGGVNTNDNIRLTTNSGTEIDLWGDTTGVDFTPTNQPGYTYRRNTTAVVPSLTWNPADWTTLDPQDYSNIGSYTFSSSNYEYSLDGGTYQTSVTFNLVAAGVHTITVHDLATGCYSLPFSVTLNAVPLVPSVTSFSYPTTPICKNDTVNPIPTPISGFTTGGTYSCLSLGASLNSASGVINLANAPSGTHIVTYTVVTNTTTCVQGGSSQFTIVINPIVTPITTINYASPVCINATTNPTQTITGITSGGTYSCITLGTSLNSTSGIIDLSNINAIAGSHTIIYSVNANPATCQVANSSNAIIVINPIVTPITVFDYATPICAIGSMSMPRPAIGFTSGGSYSSTSGLSISSSTGEIISTNSTPGNYIVTYSVSAVPASCQVSGTRTTNVVISNPVGVTITGECLGSNYSLKANAVGSSFDPTNVTYSWTDSSGLAIGTTQTITVTNPENYSVSVLSNGCTGTANLNVINTTCTVQKGISPNGDGDNESFILSDVNELSIFNRYGTKVYSHGANYTNEWHGQSNGGSELPDGTYYYVIKRGSGESVTGWIYINR